MREQGYRDIMICGYSARGVTRLAQLPSLAFRVMSITQFFRPVDKGVSAAAVQSAAAEQLKRKFAERDAAAGKKPKVSRCCQPWLQWSESQKVSCIQVYSKDGYSKCRLHFGDQTPPLSTLKGW